MTRQAQLIVTANGKSGLIRYACSVCKHTFPLPEDSTPKKAAATLLSLFKEHATKEHPEASADPSVL
jgi:hypothetical protein